MKVIDVCDNCSRYNYESDEWESIACDCACSEESLDPSATLSDGSAGTWCEECRHKVD